MKYDELLIAVLLPSLLLLGTAVISINNTYIRAITTSNIKESHGGLVTAKILRQEDYLSKVFEVIDVVISRLRIPTTSLSQFLTPNRLLYYLCSIYIIH